MNANELRNGNWILNGIIPTVINGLENNLEDVGLTNWVYKDPDGDWYSLDNCSPIELTSETLVRLGFEPKFEVTGTCYFKDGYHVYLNGWIGIYPYLSTKMCWISTIIFNVHQLQNFYYALTGKELTFTETIKHWYAKTKHTEWRKISPEEYQLTQHLARFEFKNE